MSQNTGISVKAAILYGLAIIVVAFIGVVLGNWFVQWRQAKSEPQLVKLEDWQTVNRSLLRPGERFPSEELIDMDSNTVFVDSLIAGKQTLVLFLSPGCKPCSMAIDMWKKEIDRVPDGSSVIGIGGGDLADVKAYATELDIPFPVYCDTYMLYTQQYDLVVFPTIVGLNEAGQVTLVWHGFRDSYGLSDYFDVAKSYQPDITNK